MTTRIASAAKASSALSAGTRRGSTAAFSTRALGVAASRALRAVRRIRPRAVRLSLAPSSMGRSAIHLRPHRRPPHPPRPRRRRPPSASRSRASSTRRPCTTSGATSSTLRTRSPTVAAPATTPRDSTPAGPITALRQHASPLARVPQMRNATRPTPCPTSSANQAGVVASTQRMYVCPCQQAATRWCQGSVTSVGYSVQRSPHECPVIVGGERPRLPKKYVSRWKRAPGAATVWSSMCWWTKATGGSRGHAPWKGKHASKLDGYAGGMRGAVGTTLAVQGWDWGKCGGELAVG